MPSNAKLVIGPPGTGKTTYCLNRVDEALSARTPPWRVAFLSFSRQAAREAAERAIERFHLPEKQFVWFRTLHSLAWRLNDMRWEQAYKDSDWRKFGAMMDLKFSAVLNSRGRRMDSLLEPEDCQTEGDHLARIEQFSRVMGITLEQAYEKYCETDMPWVRLQQFAESYSLYKKTRGIYDYIDIINNCSAKLDVDLCIFDEAQDMTPQQFSMATRITKDVKDVLYAGDDMQAIFAWAGADVEHFLHVAQERIVLPTSHRLPKTIWDVARNLEARVERDYTREWTYNKEKTGSVTYINNLNTLDLRNGEWLLIGRNWKLLERFYVEFLQVMGYPYLLNHTSSLEDPEILAVLDYESLRKGRTVAREAAMRVVKYMSKGELPDTKHVEAYSLADLNMEGMGNWMQALDMIPEKKREYIRALLRAGFKLRSKPNIRVDTIHGTKGSEYDNVVVLTDMAAQSYKTYMKEPASEVRLFYTGVTRAKQNLYIMEPQTDMYFTI